MTQGEQAQGDASVEGVRRDQLRRAVVASAVGTAIEWYDFFLYGVAAALVFPRQFFPRSEPGVDTLLSFSTFFVGFVARPVGAAIFGHFGDRLGRKTSLIATLLLMGVATSAIGLVPTYQHIGIAGAVLLTLGRVLQGIGVGGEWGGSVLLAAEWSEQKQRGFIASWPQFGAPAGLVMANGALLAMNKLVSPEAFMAWGWRVPFLFSFVLVAIGFYIRAGIREPPAFTKMRDAGTLARAPVREVLQKHWREVIWTALLRSGQQVPFYLFTTYVLTYGTTVLGRTKGEMLRNVILSSLASMLAIPLWGAFSDRVGRRRLVAVGAALMIPWAFAYYRLLDTRVGWVMLAAVLVAQPLHDMQYAPQAAVIAESFPSRLRYSGASLGYQLASITAGGPAPLIAVALYRHYGSSTAIAAYVALTAAVSLVSLAMLPDRSRDELDAH